MGEQRFHHRLHGRRCGLEFGLHPCDERLRLVPLDAAFERDFSTDRPDRLAVGLICDCSRDDRLESLNRGFGEALPDRLVDLLPLRVAWSGHQGGDNSDGGKDEREQTSFHEIHGGQFVQRVAPANGYKERVFTGVASSIRRKGVDGFSAD
jgi:hypothetical protein